MSAYSQDLRDRVIAACQAREQAQEKIAQRFQVSLSWLKKIWHRQRTTGSSVALAHGGGASPKLTPAHTERLRQKVADQPDATLAELQKRSGAPVTPSRICQVLSVLGLPRKKTQGAGTAELRRGAGAQVPDRSGADGPLLGPHAVRAGRGKPSRRQPGGHLRRGAGVP